MKRMPILLFELTFRICTTILCLHLTNFVCFLLKIRFLNKDNKTKNRIKYVDILKNISYKRLFPQMKSPVHNDSINSTARRPKMSLC